MANPCFETNSDMLLQNEKEVVVSTTRWKYFPLLENWASHSDGTFFLLTLEFLTKIKPHLLQEAEALPRLGMGGSLILLHQDPPEPFGTVVDIFL